MASEDLSWLGSLAEAEESPAYDLGNSLIVASTLDHDGRASLPSMTAMAPTDSSATTTLKRQNAVRRPKNRRTLPTIWEVNEAARQADGTSGFIDTTDNDTRRHTTGSRFYEHIERPATIRTMSETEDRLGLGARIKRWVKRALDRET